MNIVMLDKVEDSHPFTAVHEETGKAKVMYDVQVIPKGTRLTSEEGTPFNKQRLSKFVKMGFARELTEEEMKKKA